MFRSSHDTLKSSQVLFKCCQSSSISLELLAAQVDDVVGGLKSRPKHCRPRSSKLRT